MRAKNIIGLTGRFGLIAVISGAGLVFWFVFGIFFLPSVHADGFLILVVVPSLILGLTCITSALIAIGLLIKNLITYRRRN